MWIDANTIVITSRIITFFNVTFNIKHTHADREQEQELWDRFEWSRNKHDENFVYTDFVQKKKFIRHILPFPYSVNNWSQKNRRQFFSSHPTIWLHRYNKTITIVARMIIIIIIRTIIIIFNKCVTSLSFFFNFPILTF